MTPGYHLQPTVLIMLHMILDTLLPVFLLPCPIIQSTLSIHNRHVLKMSRAGVLPSMTQLLVQRMVGLTQGCHQHQPFANKAHPKVGNPVQCKCHNPLGQPIAVWDPSK